jgi:hypothetical protein
LAALPGCKAATSTLSGPSGEPRLVPIPTSTTATAYYATGTLRPSNNLGLCLTRMAAVISGDPVATTRCVEGDAFQQWYMYRVHNVGQVSSLADPELYLGQEGDTNFNVRIFDSREEQSTAFTSVFHWNLADLGAWHIYIIGVKTKPLFMSARYRNVTTRADVATWRVSASVSLWSQSWVTPEWKVLKGSPR